MRHYPTLTSMNMESSVPPATIRIGVEPDKEDRKEWAQLSMSAAEGHWFTDSVFGTHPCRCDAACWQPSAFLERRWWDHETPWWTRRCGFALGWPVVSNFAVLYPRLPMAGFVPGRLLLGYLVPGTGTNGYGLALPFGHDSYIIRTALPYNWSTKYVGTWDWEVRAIL
jgi:hypothetical protein